MRNNNNDDFNHLPGGGDDGVAGDISHYNSIIISRGFVDGDSIDGAEYRGYSAEAIRSGYDICFNECPLRGSSSPSVT